MITEEQANSFNGLEYCWECAKFYSTPDANNRAIVTAIDSIRRQYSQEGHQAFVEAYRAGHRDRASLENAVRQAEREMKAALRYRFCEVGFPGGTAENLVRRILRRHLWQG